MSRTKSFKDRIFCRRFKKHRFDFLKGNFLSPLNRNQRIGKLWSTLRWFSSRIQGVRIHTAMSHTSYLWHSNVERQCRGEGASRRDLNYHSVRGCCVREVRTAASHKNKLQHDEWCMVCDGRYDRIEGYISKMPSWYSTELCRHVERTGTHGHPVIRRRGVSRW